MEQGAAIEGYRPSSKAHEPKRYIRTVEGVVARVGRNSITVAGLSSGPRHLQVGPRTIVCRAGRAVCDRRALVVGVAVRALFVATARRSGLAVLIELLAQPGATGASQPPSSLGLATLPVAGDPS